MVRPKPIRAGIDPAWPFFAALALAAITVVLCGVWAHLAYDDRIYPGVATLDLDLGGQTVQQAAATLGQKLAAYQRRRVSVRTGDVSLTFAPADLGFRPRAARMAEASFARGRGSSLLTELIGPLIAARLPSDLAPDWDVDVPTLDAAVRQITARIDRQPVDARLVIGDAPLALPGRDGTTLDQAASRAAIRDYLAALRTGPLVLPVVVTRPRVDAAQVEPLRARAQQILAQSFAITSGDRPWPVPSAEVRASLAYRDNPPSLAVDPSAFGPLVGAIAGQVDRPAQDARLTIAQGKVRVIPEQAGARVDQDATLAALGAAVLAGQGAVPLVQATREPSTDAAALASTAADTQRLIDRGVTLMAGNVAETVTGPRLGDLLTVSTGDDGTPGLALDPAKLGPVIAAVNRQFERPAVNTRFAWKDGRVSFLGASRAGWVVDQPAARQAVLAHWRDGRVALPVVESPTALDESYLARITPDLKGVIQDRATTFAGSIPERAHNVALAAQRLDGALVPPGAEFSFNQTVGPTTLRAGFQWGFAFTTDASGQDRTVPSVAGGLCQVASTVFQPVFWAGYEVDERHYHLFWIKHYEDRGYLGLDATVAPEDGVDFKFANDTTHALLVHAWTDSDELMHVQLIGTKPDWTVKVDPEKISAVIPAPTAVLRTTSPLFARGRVIYLENAQTGLTSQVTRHVIYSDGHARTLDLKSIYQPANLAVLVGTG